MDTKTDESVEKVLEVAQKPVTDNVRIATRDTSKAPKGPKGESTAVRSVAESIHDLAGAVLFEAGFGNSVLDREELVEVLRMIEDCREEGRPLYPDILLTTSLKDCLEPIHPVQLVICGESEDRPGRFRRSIKRCAPVAVEPWVIVLEVSSKKLRYGIASTNVRADAPSLYEAVFDCFAGGSEFPILFLRRHGSRAVLLKTIKGQQVVSLTLSDELLKADDDIQSFSKQVAQKSDESTRANTERVIQRLIQQACREGHGLIASVIEPTQEKIAACKAAFPDGAWLDPAIDLTAPQIDKGNLPAALENDGALRARLNLARRMVETDLMTVFSADGKLLGYNVHIPASKSLGTAGGARSRAFLSLKEHAFFKGAFMCSQDGLTKYEEFNNVAK